MEGWKVTESINSLPVASSHYPQWWYSAVVWYPVALLHTCSPAHTHTHTSMVTTGQQMLISIMLTFRLCDGNLVRLFELVLRLCNKTDARSLTLSLRYVCQCLLVTRHSLHFLFLFL